MICVRFFELFHGESCYLEVLLPRLSPLFLPKLAMPITADRNIQAQPVFLLATQTWSRCMNRSQPIRSRRHRYSTQSCRSDYGLIRQSRPSLPEGADPQIKELWGIRSPADVRSDPYRLTILFENRREHLPPSRV